MCLKSVHNEIKQETRHMCIRTKANYVNDCCEYLSDLFSQATQGDINRFVIKLG